MRFSLDHLLATAVGILKLVSAFAGLIVSQMWWKKTAVPVLGKLGKRSHKLEATVSDIRWKPQSLIQMCRMRAWCRAAAPAQLQTHSPERL